MALFKSQVLTQASGSVGGMTYTRTKSGLTLRARAVPVQPVSAARDLVQNNLATLSQQWSNTLTSGDRSGWINWAANSPYVNKLGDPLILSGQQAFIANNSPRLLAGQTTITVAPGTFGLGHLSPVTVSIAAVSGNASVGFTNTDDWAGSAFGSLLLFVSKPVPLARDFFKGPYQFAGTVDGNSTPPTSPATVPTPSIWIAGQKFFWRAYATQADGLLTNVFTGQGIVS